MAKRVTTRVWVKVLTADEKAAIGARCERLISDKLKPLYLPEVRPTEFNYPIDMFGRWRGSKYSFIVRFRSGWPDNLGEEFDAGYARLDHVEESIQELRFDVMWHRHTGQWWRLHAALMLDEALPEVERMIPPV
ncbi:MAG: hypothetical protein HQ465_27120 [Rhodospirillales bacterium]|nr:hypothetical protein [Rhodospirillales bacterium]